MANDKGVPWLHGTLDLVLLALLAEERDYGVGLTARIERAGLGTLAGGTLYPSLLRLERRHLVRSVSEQSPSGPPRKYYELTPEGRRSLGERADEWMRFVAAMELVAPWAAGRTRES